MELKYLLYTVKMRKSDKIDGKSGGFMEWIQVLTIVAVNVIFAAILIRWSGKEGRAFRKKLRNHT